MLLIEWSPFYRYIYRGNMSFFLYLLGLAAGAAMFFYIVLLYSHGKSKAGRKKTAVSPQTGNGAVQERQPIFTIPPGERMCPLCRTMLTKREALYASKIALNDTNKLLILGCRYCYKED